MLMNRYEAVVMNETFVRLGHLESMVALPLGRVALDESARTALGPRESLDAIVSAALRLGTTYVMFSGGRDSSAVLALATRASAPRSPGTGRRHHP
jgi:hypothetical protein